jgi:cytochrome c-type biogenesis protein CcmE
MKTIHIIALVAIAVAVGILVSVAGDFGTYSNFDDVLKAPDQTHQIVGTLVVDKPIAFDAQSGEFTFSMKDKNGIEKPVVFHGAKPQDFERTEQIVLTGRLDGERFLAEDMLLKCPSKYDQSFTAEKR